MSILVKGMEMPEHCGYCRFRYDGICHALQKTKYNKEDCPLVPVPPHGALKDADALMEKAVLVNTDEECYMCVMADDISDAPTIIESDWKYGVKVITRGNCMICGKELTDGLLFCKECEEKAERKEEKGEETN